MAAEGLVRECAYCGLEKLCLPKRRQCRDCATIARREYSHRTGEHVPGRKPHYRQLAEVKGVIDGVTSWVTCSKCRLLKPYHLRSDGKGAKGWRGLTCPDCSNAQARRYAAQAKENGPKSGPCSKCGAEGEYANGRQCGNCYRAQRNSYARQRREKGKGRRTDAPAYRPGQEPVKVCSGCRQRKAHVGKWIANRCPECVKESNAKSRAKLKQRMVEAGKWECSECREIHPVDAHRTGWMAQRCPVCTRARDRARDKGQRAKTARRAYQRRKAAPKPVQGGVTPLTADTARDTAAVRAYVLAMAAQGLSPEQIRDSSPFLALGQVESVVKAEQRRRAREEQDASP